MPLHGPTTATEWEPTGEIRARFTFYGKCVIQVREKRQIGRASPINQTYRDEFRWRDARTPSDFRVIESNGIVTV